MTRFRFDKYRLFLFTLLIAFYPFLMGFDYEAALNSQTAGVTNISQVTLVLMIVMSILLLTLPRNQAIIPFIIMVFIVPAQCIAIANVNFYTYRIMIIVGCARLILRSEMYLGKNKVDKAMYLMVIVVCAVYFLQWQTTRAIVYRLGYALDMAGG